MTDQAAKITKTILKHLEATGQTSLLGQVVALLQKSSVYQRSSARVTVTSAAALSAAELKSLRRYLNHHVGSTYNLNQQIDPTLLAGFTLQIGDTFIDASILGKINSLHNQLTAKESS